MGKDLRCIGELRNTAGNLFRKTKVNSESPLQGEIKRELGNAKKALSEKMNPAADSFKKEAPQKRDLFKELLYEFADGRCQVDDEEMIIKI